MKRVHSNIMKVSLIIFAVLLGIVLLRMCPRSTESLKNREDSKNRETYQMYRHPNSSLHFTFEYPSKGWIPKESHGTSQTYDAVQLLGPRDMKNKYSTHIAVIVKPLQPKELDMDLLGLFLDEMKRFDGFKFLRKEDWKIQNDYYPAAVYEYYLRLPFWAKNAKDVLIKETTVFVVRGNKSYRITYSGTSDQSEASRAVFHHFLKTFKF